jgi:hypothetical protein
MSNAYKQEWQICGIAEAGVYATTVPVKWGSSTSIGSVTTYVPMLKAEVGNLIEGGVVVDKRTVKIDNLIHYVVSGPMLDTQLPPGTAKDWDKVKPCEDAKNLKSFDYVSLDLYLKLWRELGARIGQRKGDQIIWEDGRVWNIPDEEHRYIDENGKRRSSQDELRELGMAS